MSVEKTPRWMRAVGVAVVAIVVLVLWSSVYTYETVPTPAAGSAGTLVRINRLTGSTREYIDGRWVWARSRPLPTKELRELTMYAGMRSDGALSGNIYNGSSWTVTQVLVRVGGQALRERPRAPAGPWSRTVVVPLRLPPRSTQLVRIPVTDPLEMNDRQLEFEPWVFGGASGYPP